ncbi:alanine/glycine:cation symporter family protein [Catenovulum sediminis]|uniref:Amino acid carrier protein n=1 Tax=Catenovulum sediminis TaxID=1740262 RepID=A0ABV1RL33_9ALTE
MDSINQFLLSLDQYLGSAVYFPYLLLAVGVFFTFYLGFPQIRFFKAGWAHLFEKKSQPGAQGDTSHFQALTTALSGTVGTGNIGGVGLAIFLGGPAALFWMWMTAFLGMATKYVEVTLSHKYRVQTSDVSFSGGPMYYMDRKLNARWLAILFAVAVVISSFGTGSMPQINNIALAMETSFDIQPMVTGAVLSILLALVIIGGIKRIAKVTARLVPMMAVVYFVSAISVAVYNYDNILPSLTAIFTGVFTGSAATGGFLGASFAYAFSRGVNRGLFSNEAGAGSAAIAHASARTKDPVNEGKVAILEPFIDTLVLCTLTGLVILSSGVWYKKHLNQFDAADMYVIQGEYHESSEENRQQLYAWLNAKETHEVKFYQGELLIRAGKITTEGVTLINARSIAEQVEVLNADGEKYKGFLTVDNGRIVNSNIHIQGYSLIHSTALTAVAFSQGWFGQYGEYLVAISILLFAFSTAISWSYYGDRAMTYLFGSRSVVYFRISYVLGFFIAAITDTTIIWNLAAVTVVLMTLPNLAAIVLLHKDMKATQQRHLENKS